MTFQDHILMVMLMIMSIIQAYCQTGNSKMITCVEGPHQKKRIILAERSQDSQDYDRHHLVSLCSLSTIKRPTIAILIIFCRRIVLHHRHLERHRRAQEKERERPKNGVRPEVIISIIISISIIIVDIISNMIIMSIIITIVIKNHRASRNNIFNTSAKLGEVSDKSPEKFRNGKHKVMLN